MIRIERAEGLDLMTLLLSGHIQADDLPELKRIIESHGQSVVLNLVGIKLVDREAIRFLAEFEAAKGRITGCPTYIREWIRSERAEG